MVNTPFKPLYKIIKFLKFLNILIKNFVLAKDECA